MYDKNNNNRIKATIYQPIYCNLRENMNTQTPNDPYGYKGPLPPTDYRILPKPEDKGKYPVGTPSITGFDKDTPGYVRTPNGTERTVLRIHGPGLSEGCLACEWGADTLVHWAMKKHCDCGGTYLTVYEAGKASDYQIAEFMHPESVPKWTKRIITINVN